MRQPKIEELSEAKPSGLCRRLMPALFDHWCLKRSRFLYMILHPIYGGRLRINILMKCREDCSKDSGHAWLSKDGTAILEWRRRLYDVTKTKIGEAGKYTYWIQQ